MKNQNQNQEIKRLMLERMAKEVLTEKAVAEQLGIDTAGVNNFINEKWTVCGSKLVNKLADWCGYKSLDWKIRETANLNAITDLLNDAQENQRFMAISGPTGYGKTVSLRRYCEKNANAYYMLCDKSMGPRDFLGAILKAMRIEEGGTVNARVKAIAEHLNNNQLSLLVCDDCGKLSDKCLMYLQIIYDHTEGNCGMVIAGTTFLKNYLFKMAEKDKNGFRELRRRIAYWLPLTGIKESFLNKIYMDYGITEQPAQRYIRNQASDYGTLKNLMDNYARALQRGAEGASQLEVLAALRVGTIHFEQLD